MKYDLFAKYLRICICIYIYIRPYTQVRAISFRRSDVGFSMTVTRPDHRTLRFIYGKRLFDDFDFASFFFFLL